MIVTTQTHHDFNPEERSKTIRDVIWSMAVQHGPGGANSIISSALKNSEGLTDEQLIDRIYEKRRKYIERELKGRKKPIESDPDGPIHRRYIREKREALEMLKNEQQKE